MDSSPSDLQREAEAIGCPTGLAPFNKRLMESTVSLSLSRGDRSAPLMMPPYPGEDPRAAQADIGAEDTAATGSCRCCRWT